ncbi:hypothetical protein [Dactylosporangium sp. CA-092794]|uniref:hypothetical protein n=1 Tax=Dactylosporangium sp. CA-092794 TaxID=3239929 RepID=UPI003D8B303B
MQRVRALIARIRKALSAEGIRKSFQRIGRLWEASKAPKPAEADEDLDQSAPAQPSAAPASAAPAPQQGSGSAAGSARRPGLLARMARATWKGARATWRGLKQVTKFTGYLLSENLAKKALERLDERGKAEKESETGSLYRSRSYNASNYAPSIAPSIASSELSDGPGFAPRQFARGVVADTSSVLSGMVGLEPDQSLYEHVDGFGPAQRGGSQLISGSGGPRQTWASPSRVYGTGGVRAAADQPRPLDRPARPQGLETNQATADAAMTRSGRGSLTRSNPDAAAQGVPYTQSRQAQRPSGPRL